ncbi:unnamed protein product [Peniophora sp. CBMAI 1063]|nr:unnamed protein product [Peniophora sp. CBMAI 1063]
MSIVSYLAAPPSAIQQCSNPGATIVSCFPTDRTTVYQGDTIDFVWNSNLPEFAQSGIVDIKVFRALGDIEPSVLGLYNITNPTDGSAGKITVDVADSWFDGPYTGVNISTPFFFTIAPSGTIPQKQPTFRAIQTGPGSNSSFPSKTMASGSAVANATASTI